MTFRSNAVLVLLSMAMTFGVAHADQSPAQCFNYLRSLQQELLSNQVVPDSDRDLASYRQSIAQKIYAELAPRISALQKNAADKIKSAKDVVFVVPTSNGGYDTSSDINQELEASLTARLLEGSIYENVYNFCPGGSKSWDTITHGNLCVKSIPSGPSILANHFETSDTAESLESVSVKFVVDDRGTTVPAISFVLSHDNQSVSERIEGTAQFSGFSVESVLKAISFKKENPGSSEISATIKRKLADFGCSADFNQYVP